MLYFQQKICNQALSNGEDGLACNEKEREKGLFDFLVISLEISKVQNIEPFLYNFFIITFKNFRCTVWGNCSKNDYSRKNKVCFNHLKMSVYFLPMMLSLKKYVYSSFKGA